MIRKVLLSFATSIFAGLLAFGVWQWIESTRFPAPGWTPLEALTISSLWLGNLPPLGPDPSNAVADNPDAIRFGHQLFFDTRFSGNGQVACATCHQPSKHFTDGAALATGMGITGRSSPSIVGTSFHPFIFWDGRADGQWAQALGPMESTAEHGGSRMQYAHLIATDSDYRQQYEALFGVFPDLSDDARFPARAGPVDAKANPEVAAAWDAMSDADRTVVSRIYSNIGKSIAAYERLMQSAPSRFDQYAKEIQDGDNRPSSILSRDEVAGLRLFIGDGRCIECHNGPLLSNDSFHNVGTPHLKGKPFDFGRSIGAHQVVKSEFNCLSEYSDAEPLQCAELRFVKRSGDDLTGSFKVPGLRNVTKTAPYMHAGQLADLDAVMEHYNDAPVPLFGHTMLTKLEFEPHQLQQMIDFLHALDSDLTVDPKWLRAPEQPLSQASTQ
ncbi:MAG TPA: cytochrome-c peroxidase [Chromatiaceae bacterium]|jgi:cytochrome c peroxidase|nr:cytochrome-c peroxidase [Chromatiaceae bacterium]HIB83864.1 cytochrome-c peroxidase [Chromatiaceae bacterium]HIN82182.1 cytochrome-c peroxidase [Chromatiales bacterium]HIO14782.1 cytochrome-c peroxidase [Chromatiales bacterium]HIO55130.1 cytochrome-c peroxidase [Chromatiales bacterium]